MKEKSVNFDAHSSSFTVARRSVLLGATAAAGLALLGCSASGSAENPAEADTGAAPGSGPRAMLVYRDPSCGCCEAWAAIAQKAGYEVDLRDHLDMPGLKRSLGVPQELASCHTAQIGGLVIEGHVPLEDVARLLEEKPAGVKGIGVAGMPIGSPGMEVPDGTKQPFQVMAFDAAGEISRFSG